jgi:EmrB/QacA subfamily drug resistance transporter
MDASHPERQHYNVTLAVLTLGTVAYALLQSLVAPALPDIQHALHTSESSVSWVLTGYLLSASVATPIIGRLGDMYGKERMLMIVLAMLAVGTLLAAVASSIGLLIAARIVQGAGGGIFPLAFGIVRDEFPREKVAGGIGLLSSLLGIGGGAGVVLAGVIVDHVSYHWLFWLPLAAIVIAAVATHFFVPESPVKVPGRINWLGALLLSAGLAAVLFAVSKTSTWGWGSSRTLGLIAAGLLALVAWVAAEMRAREPLVDMRMMRIRGVWTTNVVAALLGVGMYSSFILLPLFVEEPKSTGYGFGASVTGAGMFMLPSTMMMLLVGPLSGRLERRFGSKPPLLAGALSSAVAFLLLALAHGHPWEVYIASALLGIGIGLAFAAMANLIVQNVRQDQTGVATGMNTVMRTLGGALGAQVAGTFLANNLAGDGLPTEHGYALGFVMCAGALVVGLLFALAIPNRTRRTTPTGRAPATGTPRPAPGRTRARAGA